MKKLLIMACLCWMTGISVMGQLVAWDFYGQSQPVSMLATQIHYSMEVSETFSVLTRGSGAPPSAGVHSFRTTGFQNNGISLSNSDYFQVVLKPAIGFTFSLSAIQAKFNGTSTFYASPGVTSQWAFSRDGVNFTLIGQPVQSTSLTMTPVDLSVVPELQNIYYNTSITLRYYASGQTTTGGWGFYSSAAGVFGLSFEGTFGYPADGPPTVQASGLVFSNVGTNQVSLSWTPGDGERRIVKINTVNSFTNPADGTDPAASSHYTGPGEQVIYNNSGNSLAAVTGLQPGTTYWFRIYEYNGTDDLTMFNTSTAADNPKEVTTSANLSPPVVVNPTVSAVTSSGALLGGRVTSNGGSPLAARGTVWSVTSPVTANDHPLAEGGTDTGTYVHTRTGLPAGNRIYHAAYAVNGVGTTLSTQGSFFTLSEEPLTHVSGFSATGSGTTSMDLSWSPSLAVSGGYLILHKQGATAPVTAPSDATSFTPGATLGDATVSAFITDYQSGSATVTGLSPGTVYTFSIFPFHWDGTNGATINYLTTMPAPSDSGVTAVPPAATYTWTGASGGSWTTASNWTPQRSIPAPNDILLFSTGTAITVTGVSSEPIGRLSVSGGTSVTLQGAGTLSVNGGSGNDLVVESGCQMTLSGTGAIQLSLQPGATGSIAGNITFTGGGHRLLATDASGITFQSGGVFTAGSGFTGNAFGTANLNSVLFSPGSSYIAMAGGNPFGATAPSSVVVFQHGSLYRVDAYVAPSLGGRTYGNFEMNWPGLITATGSSAVVIDNFIASQGTFYFNVTGDPGHSIKGDISVSGLATLIFSPSSAGTVHLNGTSPQQVYGTGSLMSGTNSRWIIDNPTGVTVAMDAELNHLTISSGAVFTIDPDASVTIEGDLVNSAGATGFIMESGGSLIHHSTGIEATLKRNIAAAQWSDWQDGWHFLSSPVTSQPISQAGGFITAGAGNDYDLYAWDEPANEWINFKNSTVAPTFQSVNGGSNFIPGKGYLTAYQQTGEKQFSGILNVADLPVSGLGISASGQNRGWHLLGNPFASAVTWYTDWNPLNIGGVAMIWNEEGMSYSPVNAGEPIPAMNGFMVQVTGTPGTQGSLVIPASRRVHDNQPWYKAGKTPAVRLFARNPVNGSFQESQIRFQEGSSTGYDPESDGRFLEGYGPKFYSVAGEEKLMVNTLPDIPEAMEIPFDFYGNGSNEYQIEARITGWVPARVRLVDKQTGWSGDLREVSSYGFISAPGDPPGRFALSFTHVGVENPRSEGQKIFASGKSLVISADDPGIVELWDMTGRRVMREHIPKGSVKLESGCSRGWYLARYLAGERVISAKVFIR